MNGSKPEAGERVVPVRDRLLEAGKLLFSIHGFENTSTAAIARQANTSESQLVKHFGSKEGLLESIFDEGWRSLEYIGQTIQVLNSPVDRLRMIFELVLQALERDQALKELMLFEGRRIRKSGSGPDILITGGYLRFTSLVEQIVAEIMKQSHLGKKLSASAVASALIGMFESMLRDQVMARRMNMHPSSTPDEVRIIFDLCLTRLLGSHESAAAGS